MKLDPHAFLLDEVNTKNVGLLLERWFSKGGRAEAIAHAMVEMAAFPHVRDWNNQLRRRAKQMLPDKQDVIKKIESTGYILTLQGANGRCRCCCRPFPGNPEDHEVCNLLRDAWIGMNTFAPKEEVIYSLKEAIQYLEDTKE